MADLSVFIDESGDFGSYSYHSPYYLITLVFHEQETSIEAPIARLQRSIANIQDEFDCKIREVHAGPLIRKESDFANYDIVARRKIFHALFTFMRQCDISYKSFTFSKRQLKNRDALETRMARDLGSFMRENLAFFQGFNRVIIYYDNGQKEVTRLINTVFNAWLQNAEIRKVTPSNYYLFQVADMLCTLELIEIKLEDGMLSKSEKLFFRNERTLKKNYLKVSRRKLLN